MAIPHVYNFSMTSGGASKVLTTWTSSAPNENNHDETHAIGTDVAIGFTLDISRIESITIVSSTDATLKTNSGGAPQETFALEAGKAIHWNDDMPTAIGDYFAGDVTEMYLTNAAETRLQIYAALNAP